MAVIPFYSPTGGFAQFYNRKHLKRYKNAGHAFVFLIFFSRNYTNITHCTLRVRTGLKGHSVCCRPECDWSIGRYPLGNILMLSIAFVLRCAYRKMPMKNKQFWNELYLLFTRVPLNVSFLSLSLSASLHGCVCIYKTNEQCLQD